MKRREGIGAGSASLLVVFVLLGLTTFAVLSLASAQADRRLAERTAQSLDAYYKADSAATEQLAALRLALQAVDSSLEAPPYWDCCAAAASSLSEGMQIDQTGDGLRVQFQTIIDERRALAVTAVAHRSAERGTLVLDIAAWKSIQTGEWVEQDEITLWPGNGALFEEASR